MKTHTEKRANASGGDDQQSCANCGMRKEDWRGNNGQGVQIGNKTYCCQGCATGAGCTCM